MSPSHRFARHFEARPASVAEARRFVSQVLADLGRSADESHEVALLLTSELATNAIVHAATAFEVVVEVAEDLCLAVVDGDPRLPAARAPDAGSPGGRGLAIIEALSASWGAEPAGAGKRVWCVVA